MIVDDDKEIPVKKYTAEWKYYLEENPIKNKIWNYINNYFKKPLGTRFLQKDVK